jgi:hypothetical protein
MTQITELNYEDADLDQLDALETTRRCMGLAMRAAMDIVESVEVAQKECNVALGKMEIASRKRALGCEACRERDALIASLRAELAKAQIEGTETR